MALPKSVKQGGAYYKGYELIINATTGNYILDMTQSNNSVINSTSVIPDKYGAGDTFKLSHLNSGTTQTIAVLADTIYNPGANVATLFDFPAYEKMAPGESLRLTYTNSAGTALSVHVILEYAGLVKTS